MDAPASSDMVPPNILSSGPGLNATVGMGSVRQAIAAKARMALERVFPEQRLFLRSETATRFIRLSPLTQLVGISGSALIVGWSIVATAILVMDNIGSGNLRSQSEREQALYQQRLSVLVAERDDSARTARDAIDRFNSALEQVSRMQAALLEAETRRNELERGLAAVQDTLRGTIIDRDAARAELARLRAEIEGETEGPTDIDRVAEVTRTLDMVTTVLSETADQRDILARDVAEAERQVEEIELTVRLQQERNDRIFAQLEDALAISVAPIDNMFRQAGLSTENLIETVRRGYSGQGGPLTPITFSSRGENPDPDSLRANAVLEQLDRLNLYRIAAEKAPFDIPVKASFRYTSGFGPRWGRMHNGTDFAGSHGTSILATADGVVTHASWQSGYGRLVKIQHEFGIETRYAHLSAINVSKGQRVSRGDRIGAMGNTGNSTGTHLHYEVRVGGKPVNPMTYIKAGKDVF